MNNFRTVIRDLTIASLCLAVAIVLPFFTGQIPAIGAMLCPMHIPVLICAYLCRWQWAGLIGFTAPLLRFALFSMPPMPFGIAMAFEMATYGIVAALMWKVLPKKKSGVYASLITAMVAGRVVWGAVRMIIAGVTKSEFTWSLFIGGALLEAIPGIILQLILIPVIVMAVKRERV